MINGNEVLRTCIRMMANPHIKIDSGGAVTVTSDGLVSVAEGFLHRIADLILLP